MGRAKRIYNVAIFTPTSGTVKATYCNSLVGLILYYMTTPIVKDDAHETRGVTLDQIIGSVIIAARESAVEDTLKNPHATHLLFIDDDMGFKSHILNLALSRDKPIVLANYRRKSPPWSFTAIRGNMPIELSTYEDRLEPCDFGGFGFALIQRKVLEAIQAPRFLNEWRQDRHGKWVYTTEDYPFFAKAREAGFQPLVDHEISKCVWHVGDHSHVWHEKVEQDVSENTWTQVVERTRQIEEEEQRGGVA